jgi:hypothetical protein
VTTDHPDRVDAEEDSVAELLDRLEEEGLRPVLQQ